MKIFTILLFSNKERVANVLKISSQLETVIVPAIEGSTNQLEFCLEGRKIHPDYLNFCLRGEIACILSHLKVWKEIVNQNLDNAIILEDDAVIQDDFLNNFNNLNIPETADFVYLFVHPDTYQNNSCDMLQKGYFTYGSVGYWLNQQTAKDLINMFNHQINTPVDKSISWLLSTYQKEYYCLKKNLVETRGGLYNHNSLSSIGATKKFSSDKVDFSFYIDEGEFLCYPCVDIDVDINVDIDENYSVNNSTLEENKIKCRVNEDYIGFTSNGVFLKNTENWKISEDTCIYLKSNK
jgi:GR25 family glycosyltransferase involved in LPS biosynthesis